MNILSGRGIIRVRVAGPIVKGASPIPPGHILEGKRVILHSLHGIATTTVNTALAFVAPLTGGIFLHTNANALVAANAFNMFTSNNQAAGSEAFTDPINNFGQASLRGELPRIIRLEECWFTVSAAAAVISITELIMYVQLIDSGMLEA